LTYTDYATIKYVKKPSAVEDETESSGKPSEFTLSQNYPNPFNPSTTIHYTVHSQQSTVHRPIHTTLSVYNILGQLVRTLVDEGKTAGHYNIIWDGKDDKGEEVSSGIYFYALVADDYRVTKKMVLLK
jgi:flagellar hook assembly protein FlgD